MVNAIQKPFSRMPKVSSSFTAFMWLHSQSRLRRSCLPGYVDKLTFFCLGITILDGNVQ